MTISDCGRCGFIYNEFEGDAKNGVPPFVKLDALKDSLCSMCGMAQDGRIVRQTTDYKGLEAEAYPFFSGKTSPYLYKLDDVEGKKILDVGAGCGRIGLAFAERGGKVTLLEKSKEMIENIPPCLARKVKIVVEDALDYVIETDYYDMIILSDGFLQHFSETEQRLLVEKYLSGLVAGGSLVVEFFIPKEMRVSVEHVKEVQKGVHFFFQATCQLHLPSKTIKTDISIQKCLDFQVQDQYRCLRFLHLILPMDIKRLLENIEGTYTHIWEEQMDTDAGILSNTMPSSGRYPLIKRDWIQGGYPFSTSDNQAVSWYRIIIKR